MNLYKYVSEAINNKLGFEAKLDVPKNRDFGDFATNAAMVGAKSAGKNPRELANEYLPLLKELDFVADVSVAGPGFINIKIKDNFILQNASAPKQMTAVKPLVIDLDYGAYNVAKSLHIGHLRTSIVGDTFNRIARFLGHKTFSWNHIGDWGKPMGLVIAWIERLHPELPPLRYSRRPSCQGFAGETQSKPATRPRNQSKIPSWPPRILCLVRKVFSNIFAHNE